MLAFQFKHGINSTMRQRSFFNHQTFTGHEHQPAYIPCCIAKLCQIKLNTVNSTIACVYKRVAPQGCLCSIVNATVVIGNLLRTHSQHIYFRLIVHVGCVGMNKAVFASAATAQALVAPVAEGCIHAAARHTIGSFYLYPYHQCVGCI